MWTAEEDGQFQRIECLAELGEIAIEFLLVLELLGLRLGFGQFNHDAEVRHLFLGSEQRLDFFAERTGFVDQLLRLLAVIPEGLPGHLGVELAEALLHARHVKETSAGVQVSHRPTLTAL